MSDDAFDLRDVSDDALAWARYRIDDRRGPNPAHESACDAWDAHARLDPLTGAVRAIRFTRLADGEQRVWTAAEVLAEVTRRTGAPS